jgi:hypothetical protein
VTIVAALAAVMAGCGAVQHSASLTPGFAAGPGTTVEVGSIVNATGRTYDIDVVDMLETQLATALIDEQLATPGAGGTQPLALNVRIVEYDRGNAFKRWLLPGWGATVLSVECDLTRRSDGRKVGTVQARRTVSAGGGDTIGAWKGIFKDVAADVAKELRGKLRA